MNANAFPLAWAGRECLRQLLNRRNGEFTAVQLIANGEADDSVTVRWGGASKGQTVVLNVNWPPPGLDSYDAARDVVEVWIAQVLGLWPCLLRDAGAGL